MIFEAPAAGAAPPRALLIRDGVTIVDSCSLPPKGSECISIAPVVIGVCASDIKEVRGVRFQRSDFGHEVVGINESGDLVVFNPHSAVRHTTAYSDRMFIWGDNPQSSLRVIAPESNIERMLWTEPTACVLRLVRKSAEALNGGPYEAAIKGTQTLIIGAGMAGTLAGLIIRYLGGKVSWVNRSPDRLTLLAELGIDVGEGDGVPPDLVLVMESRTTLSAVERARRLFPSVIGIYGETRPGELSYKGVDLDAIRRNELSAPLGRESPSVFVGSYGADLSDFQLAMVSLKDDLLGSDVSRLLQVRLSTLEAASEHLNERAKGKREIRKAAVILRS